MHAQYFFTTSMWCNACCLLEKSFWDTCLVGLIFAGLYFKKGMSGDSKQQKQKMNVPRRLTPKNMCYHFLTVLYHRNVSVVIPELKEKRRKLPFPTELTGSHLCVRLWIITHCQAVHRKIKCSKAKYSFLKTLGQINFRFKSVESLQE